MIFSDLLKKFGRAIIPAHFLMNRASRRLHSSTRYKPHKKLFYADDGDAQIVFYSRRRAGRYMKTGGIKQVYRGMISKYVPEFFELSATSTVIDVGANVGEFAMAIAPQVGQVIAFEPDKVAYAALKENVAFTEGVLVPYNVGLSDRTGLHTLFVASDTADTSFITPSQYTRTEEVETYSLIDFVKEKQINIEQVALIKIEAEGYEPEVLKGCFPDLRVKYYSVNCDPERLGQSPINEVCRILEDNGYFVSIDRFKVYAILREAAKESIEQ